MKHTSGNWTKSEFSNEVVKDSKSHTIAYISNMYRTEGEVLANTTLIAAAPELLDALEYVDSYLENVGINDRSVRGVIDEALTKARGES